MINISMSPIAFTIGSIVVRWYGVAVDLAILTLILWVLWQVRKGARVSYDTVFTAALVGIPSGVVFSRLLHVIDRWDYYGSHLNEIVGGSGLTIYGAILGAALGIWAYSRFSKVSFGYLADLIAPGHILAQVNCRVGCTINGCCYGLPTSLPWGIVYTNPDSYAPLNVAVHPTTIYEIIYLLIVFGVILTLKGKLKPDGSLFIGYLAFYAVFRLGADFLREGTPFLFGLHESQVISLVVLAVTIPMLAMRTRLVKKNFAPEFDGGN